jgi:hypothetical protein
MQQKPHAKVAKAAKAGKAEGFSVPGFYSPFSERVYQNENCFALRPLRPLRETSFSQLHG